MEKKELVRRVLFFVGGGVLVFAIMSFSVVSNLQDENEELSEALDTSRYEATRLLEDAQAQLEAGDFEEAEETLETLFANQPGSDEAAQGRELLLAIEQEESTSDRMWEEEMPEVREQFFDDMEERLLAESDAQREELESNMNDIIAEEWEDAISDVRDEWEDER